MKYDSLILEITTNYTYLIIIFLILVGIFHFFIFFVKNPSDLTWKKIDYFWLLSAMLGIIGNSGSLDRYISEEFLKNQEAPRLEALYKHIYSFSHDYSKSDGAVCSERIRIVTEFSPPQEEFDKFTTFLKLQCNYFKNISKSLPSKISQPYPSLHELKLYPYVGPIIETTYWPNDHFNQLINDYELQYKTYIEMQENTNVSSFQLITMVLSPLLICFALAIRFTKVTGDILNTKQK